ncbi:dienelactone hydrolase family protein [Thiobacter aerophilum]|uniref:Dienelactone hydrolase family protein n=1 Tax=Thiobacter aerophilum TaxID=3121275 RepID=A0ABV0EBA6_9BURK
MLQRLVHIPDGPALIEGMLEIPDQPRGIVLFAHGSGSSRHSPRNNYVAGVLREAGIGTLLMDLLTAEEDGDYKTRFDIPLLTRRLTVATQWLAQQPEAKGLPIGYFGASTGAAAALQAAAKMGKAVAAVVSRGGRPDLAGGVALRQVVAPTLLIVGSLDDVVIELNRAAFEVMTCEKELRIVPGASHLFEEPGTLEEVARLATDWFLRHLLLQLGNPHAL